MTSAATHDINLKYYRFPKSVISRFVARRTVRSAILWGLVFGVYVASKAIGFVDLYPTAAARQKIAETFSSNVGIELLLGKAPQNSSTAAYVAWNCANIMVIIGAIWALLLVTKYLRGEEDNGRTEILLSGQTSARRATLNTLAGIGASIGALFIVTSLLFMAVGRSHGVDFGSSAALYFAFTVALGISVYMMIGALASQLMPTRAQAASVTATILGLSFLFRAIADVTSAHWLLNVTPLGWLEKMQPLAGAQPLWIVPPLLVVVLALILTIYFAGKRDLGESIIKEKASTKPSFRMLNSALGLNIRLTRAYNIGWLVGIFLFSTLYGLITKSTGNVFNQSKGFHKVFKSLSQHQLTSSSLAFLGIVFLLQMILIMVFMAGSLSAIRRDEANGYVDNFLTQPISRFRWLGGRLLVVIGAVILAGLVTSAGVWLGTVNQNLGISFHTLISAGINALIPAVLVIGVGVFTFGIYPRLTSAMAYGVLAWSFLIDLLGSGLNLNHWLLDTSVVHQVVPAPSVNPNWSLNLIIVLIAVVLASIGILRFNSRDIEGE